MQAYIHNMRHCLRDPGHRFSPLVWLSWSCANSSSTTAGFISTYRSRDTASVPGRNQRDLWNRMYWKIERGHRMKGETETNRVDIWELSLWFIPHTASTLWQQILWKVRFLKFWEMGKRAKVYLGVVQNWKSTKFRWKWVSGTIRDLSQAHFSSALPFFRIYIADLIGPLMFSLH